MSAAPQTWNCELTAVPVGISPKTVLLLAEVVWTRSRLVVVKSPVMRAFAPLKFRLPEIDPPARGRYVLDADDVVRYELMPLIVWYVEAALAVVR
jgi:hypothetical protein